MPQKPVWVDGSGLSRYNLFTPEDWVYLLQKIETDFGTVRIKNIFPTGNEGTLKNFYENKRGFMYAKTGTLSGQYALSGYLVTKKKSPLIFSILINNHVGKSASVRKAAAEYVDWIWSKY
jgi:D-alanyl-D-alanine carboxypeptidase/D-alanyl-D-alanine-endopeptidase (penicillin-binding protein 4)